MVMNVKMCCVKCEEKVKEECEEVEGKFMYFKSSFYFLIVSNVWLVIEYFNGVDDLYWVVLVLNWIVLWR